MLKKAGLLTVGVTAGLLAVAPIASAGVSEHDSDNDKSHSKDVDGDHHKKDRGDHHKSKNHNENNGEDNFAASCDFSGGDAEAGSGIDGDSLANAVAQAPVGGNNIGNLANCSSFLNDNFQDIDVDVL